MAVEQNHFRSVLLGWFIVAIALAGAAGAQSPAEPPPAVVVEQIELQPVSDTAAFNARVEAIESVDLRARVGGFLQSVGFEAGQFVEPGTLLFEIEPDQYEAGLASARAQLSGANARRTAAERNLARIEELVQRDVGAQATLDQSRSEFESAAADVLAAEAAVTGAELNLSYTRIEAPIAGVIGRATLSVGNLVGPDAGILARIVQLDPVRVVFSIPEGLLVNLRQEANGGDITAIDLRLRLRLPNGTEYEQDGTPEYIASEVDPQTGTIAVRIVFPNPDRLLVPGQFVTLYAGDSDPPQMPIVPQTAVLQDRDGRYVYLLGDDNSVAQRRITTGVRVGSGWAVTEGLEGGETVVVQGIQRLAEGMSVQPSQAEPTGDRP